MCGHPGGHGCGPRAGRPSAPGARPYRRGRRRCRRARARRPCPHATARPAGRASGRARRPTARVPPAPDAGALPPGQPRSASESASTAIQRNPHQHQITGPATWTRMAIVPAGGQQRICPATAISARRARAPGRHDRRAGDLPTLRGRSRLEAVEGDRSLATTCRERRPLLGARPYRGTASPIRIRCPRRTRETSSALQHVTRSARGDLHK